MRIFISGILLFLVFISCQTKTDRNKNNSFSFTMQDQTDFVDSRGGEYIRVYTNRSKTVHFKFTRDEIQRIESLYLKIKLDTLPDIFKPNCLIAIIPSFEETFIVNCRGKVKRFTYNSDYDCPEDKTKMILENIECFRDSIIEILSKKKELYQLEASDIIFF